MNRSQHAQGFAPLDETITVLFCLVDDVYRNINPNARPYQSLKKLSDSEVTTLALFQQLRGILLPARGCPACCRILASKCIFWVGTGNSECPQR